jgi:hypothetical protein
MAKGETPKARERLLRSLDKAPESCVVAEMVDRFILLILFGLIVVYTAVMVWANGRNPPE